jgi:hypothetical protein
MKQDSITALIIVLILGLIIIGLFTLWKPKTTIPTQTPLILPNQPLFYSDIFKQTL